MSEETKKIDQHIEVHAEYFADKLFKKVDKKKLDKSIAEKTKIIKDNKIVKK